MNNKGYFWYSKEQRKTIDLLNIAHPITNYCQLDNGKIKEYTEWTLDNKPSGKWEDYVFLGHGEYHHSV